MPSGWLRGPASRHEARQRAPLALAAPLAAGLLGIFAALGPVTTPLAPQAVRAADDDPFFLLMQAIAFDNGRVLTVSPGGLVTDQDIGDFLGAPNNGADITRAGLAELPMVPSFLLDRTFMCGRPNVACPSTGSQAGDFAQGAYLFYQRQDAQLEQALATGIRYEWGPILRLDGYPAGPAGAGNPFSGASHAIITRAQGTTRDVLLFANQGGAFQSFRSRSRSMWMGMDVLTLVPKGTDIQRPVTGWDAYGYWTQGTPATTGRDNMRGFNGEALLTPGTIATLAFEAPPSSPTSAATQAPASSATASAPAASGSSIPVPAQTSPPATGAGSTAGPGVPWAIVLLIGLLLMVLGGWLLIGRSRAKDPCPPLVEAARRARAECEAAQARARAAALEAEVRAAEAATAAAAAEQATRARQAAEQALADRERPPDRSGDSASTTWEGRTVTEDAYDRRLLEEARAAANDAWSAAKAAATTDAQRMDAHRAWQEELQRLDGPDGIDEVRRRDAADRPRQIQQAKDALTAARQAEAEAVAAAQAARATAEAAAAAGAAAGAAAAEACAAAARAEAAAAACLEASASGSGVAGGGKDDGTGQALAGPGGTPPGGSTPGSTPGTTSGATPGSTPGTTPPASTPRRTTTTEVRYDAALHCDLDPVTYRGGMGHAWAGLRKTTVVRDDQGTILETTAEEIDYDFAPAGNEGTFAVVIGGVDGKVLPIPVRGERSGRGTNEYYPVSAEGYDRARAWADAAIASPPTYRATTYNCVDFALDLVRQSGAPVPTDVGDMDESNFYVGGLINVYTPSNLVAAILAQRARQACTHDWVRTPVVSQAMTFTLVECRSCGLRHMEQP